VDAVCVYLVIVDSFCRRLLPGAGVNERGELAMTCLVQALWSSLGADLRYTESAAATPIDRRDAAGGVAEERLH